MTKQSTSLFINCSCDVLASYPTASERIIADLFRRICINSCFSCLLTNNSVLERQDWHLTNKLGSCCALISWVTDFCQRPGCRVRVRDCALTRLLYTVFNALCAYFASDSLVFALSSEGISLWRMSRTLFSGSYQGDKGTHLACVHQEHCYVCGTRSTSYPHPRVPVFF